LNFFGTRHSYTYKRCTTCGTIQLDPLPSFEHLKDAYISDYAKKGHYCLDPQQSLRANKPFYKAILLILINNKLAEGRILDIGCGWGGLCYLLEQEGLEYIGVDLSQEEVRFCQSEGLNVVQGDINSFDAQREIFSAITLIAVFEHIVDHDQLLMKAKRLLKPDGVLIILSPTARFASLAGRLFQLMTGRRELPAFHKTFCPPWHPVLFSIEGLKSLIARYGMTIEKIIPSPSKSDKGIVGIVQKFATIMGRLGFSVKGEKWPFLISHIFLCRKK